MKDYFFVLVAILLIYFSFSSSSVNSQQLALDLTNVHFSVERQTGFNPQAIEGSESPLYQPQKTKIKNGFIVLASPEDYLNLQYKNYTRSILGEAVFVYQQAKANNLPEKAALEKAVNLLKNANFTQGVTSSLLKSVYSSEDSDYAKILKSYI